VSGSDLFSVFTLLAGVVGLGYILWQIRSGTADREREDDARDFFAEHGRWPDETPEEAAARREVGAVSVAQPDEHGRV